MIRDPQNVSKDLWKLLENGDFAIQWPSIVYASGWGNLKEAIKTLFYTFVIDHTQMSHVDTFIEQYIKAINQAVSEIEKERNKDLVQLIHSPSKKDLQRLSKSLKLTKDNLVLLIISLEKQGWLYKLFRTPFGLIPMRQTKIKKGQLSEGRPSLVILNAERIETIEPYRNLSLEKGKTSPLKTQIKVIEGGYYYSLIEPEAVLQEIRSQTTH